MGLKTCGLMPKTRYRYWYQDLKSWNIASLIGLRRFLHVQEPELKSIHLLSLLLFSFLVPGEEGTREQVTSKHRVNLQRRTTLSFKEGATEPGCVHRRSTGTAGVSSNRANHLRVGLKVSPVNAHQGEASLEIHISLDLQYCKS